ncbi:MAG: carbohydrate binding domain-containing protein, partial [Muribaculaceae bacterium]|nr:carbohydrate binding domain-containing protein [Muribaculaceae bacterium]
MKKQLLSAILAVGCLASAGAAVNKLVVEPNAKGAPIPSTMYGLFFEDINYAADGGLYAEKIKNRSFDFPTPLQGWNAFGKVEVRNDGPFDKNPNYVRLSPAGHTDKWTGLDNEGFFGVSFEKDKDYNFSVWARVPDGGTSKVRVELEDPATMGEGQDKCSKEFEVKGSEWKQYKVTLKPSETVVKGKLRIFLCKPETTVDLEHVSL